MDMFINIHRYLVLVFLFYGSALGARTKLLSSKNDDSSSVLDANADDGICKLRVEIFGYDCEEHTVTTQDGYIISLQRIPVGKSNETSGARPPVLIQHGVLMDGRTWLLNYPNQSLAFILAENGFDVWIGNTRGTKFSRRHTSLSPDNPVYWDWTWDQLVAYELPATFQYVHDQTGQKLHYVGHSLGTLIALAAFSQEMLLDNLRSAALLSPVAYVGQMTSQLARTAAEKFVAENLYWLGIDEFAPRGYTYSLYYILFVLIAVLHRDAVAKLLKDICKKPGINCYDLMSSFTGKNCCLNSSTVDVFLENEPQSSSTKNMIHLAQMIRYCTIAMYNYGDDDKNRKHYGQPKPPLYDMKSIPSDIPLFLSYGGGADTLSDVNDVKMLLDDLKDHDRDNLVVQYLEDYAHADFVMAVNAKEVVYDPVMAFFKVQ